VRLNNSITIASPHRYADLARLWYRFARRELGAGLARRGIQLDFLVFCDAGGTSFTSSALPGVRLLRPQPGMRDFIEFYDAALSLPCEFLFFADADAFFLNGEWIASYPNVFQDPDVAAVSFVPRKSRPAIFALLCRADAFRELPRPVFACRYEFPQSWPNGTNLQPGDLAFKELNQRGKRVINVDCEKSSKFIAMFRSTTGVRVTREHIIRESGSDAFCKFLQEAPDYVAAAYDNMLLGALYERLFGEPFATDGVTSSELKHAITVLRDRRQLASLREKFRASENAIHRMAAREGVELDLATIIDELGVQR